MIESRAALDDALSGHGRLVMLVGEPGHIQEYRRLTWQVHLTESG